MKIFTDLLVERQGGLSLKPGRIYVKILTKVEILELFGGIPAFLTIGNIHVRVQEIEPEMFKIFVRKVL